jgi:hypothetical protein
MNEHKYLSFSIIIHMRVDERAETRYWYEIRGSGLREPIVTNETFNSADRALGYAQDFIDEHLVSAGAGEKEPA